MQWIECKKEVPHDDLRVLLCDINGHISIGKRDEHGYSEDVGTNEVYDIVYWAYLPIAPIKPFTKKENEKSS